MHRIFEILQSGSDFSDYFYKNDIKNVVVYGIGTYGKLLISELEKYNISIVSCIDKKVLCYKNYIVHTPDEEIPECDAIIVSPVNSDEIVQFLTGRVNYKIITFTEIIQQKELEIRGLKHYIVKPYLEYMVLNILDHCNLRCKGCDHFACIASPYFVSVEQIYMDLKRMSELFHGDGIMQIAVMGGEPLLHPELLEILKIVRYFFPNTIIRLTTNGLLLLKQNDEFWKVCRENKVTIVNTKYPINLDYEAMQNKAKREMVKFRFFEGTGDNVVKKSFKKIINLKGNSNIDESFQKCHIANYGNFLMEGKFYGCPFSCQSYRIFNSKYDMNLQMTEDDYLDIYKIQNKEEIFEFAAKPRLYCRYCNGLSPTFDWTRSEFKKEEWIEDKD